MNFNWEQAMKYDIYKIVGENAITSEDGQKLYNLICEELLKGKEVELDFSKVKIFASPFFNFGIGQLLKSFKYEDLKTKLHLIQINIIGKHILDKVLENAKNYYTDPNLKKAVDKIIDERENNVWH